MKILLILLLLVPTFLFGQGHVGVGTITPDHPFQVNVDSIWTDTVPDAGIPPSIAISPGLAIVPGSQKGAQRFTVEQTGFLSQLQFWFTIPTVTSELLIEVFRGAGPEGELIASKTELNIVVGTRIVYLPQPWPTVTAGEEINIVMTPVSGASCKWKGGSYELPEYTAFHYTGIWDSITIDLAFTAFVTYTDTVVHDVLKVRDDKRVMINDYALPREDGNIGEVIKTNGSGNLSWSSPEALNVSVLQDTDQDTKVEVEATPDDDMIRMKVAGQQKMTILPNGKVGLNIATPLSDLDIRGDHNANDGGELQLATPTMTNFIRMFSGRTADPHPFIAFSDQDYFHFVTTTSTWQNFTRRMTISPVGNVGIGTDDPSALFQVNNGAVMFKGPAADLPPTPADPPATGAGTRMMWYPDKAAFRVGRVTGTAWDKDSIGLYSFAGGVNNMAKGIFGFVGSGQGGNHALGAHSFVGNGLDNIASGDYSFIGNGNDNTASGIRSFIGVGGGNTAMGESSFIGGSTGSIASGDFSFIGSGQALLAKSFAETAFGLYATDYTPVSASMYNEADRLFVIGNGTSNSNRRDAFTIFKNGSIGIGTSTPESRIHVEGSTTSSQNILSVQNNYVGTTNVWAVEAISNPANGYGVGGHFTGGSKGVYGRGEGGGSGTTTIGLEGSAFGGGGTKIGLQGDATGSGTNWAGYFNGGHVYITNELRVGSDALSGATGYKVAIDGKLIAEEVRVQLSSSWPDYVFDDDYPLRPLSDVKASIQQHGHLPGIPSAAQVENDGLHLGDMQIRILEKMEEMMLYILQQEEKIKALETEIKVIKNQNSK